MFSVEIFLEKKFIFMIHLTFVLLFEKLRVMFGYRKVIRKKILFFFKFDCLMKNLNKNQL